ncbi:MAG: EscU/YscU/HrcU family type III secretion system export apparatus switch protein [Rhodospirillales bacterium]|nr:EscU/YscU/HrcU family type III secretion system export apparatus switch protein [Rhodospirillales bacterium]
MVGAPAERNLLSESEKNHDSGDKKQAVAVALAHDLIDSRPPRVVAGGRGHIAEQILEIAFANGVKVREDADLAQLLSSIDIDTEIPVEAFAAVSEILTYVYQANAGTPGPDNKKDGGLSTQWSKEQD